METKQERYIRWGAFAASHLVALLAGLACVVLSVWGMEIIATQPNPDAGKSEAIMMGPQIKRVESKLDHLDLEGFPELKIKREEINGALSIGKRLLGEKDWSRAVPCLAGVTNGWAVLMKGLAQSEAEVAAEIGVKLESLSVEGSETFKEKSGQIVQHFTEGKEKLAVGEFEVAVDFFSLGRKKWSSLAKDMATEMEARADKANAGLASLEVESTQLKEQVVKCEEKLAVGRTAFGKEEFENAVRYFREVVSLAEVIQMEVAKEKATGLKKTALECRQIAQKVLKQCDGIAKLRELKEKTDDIKKTFESGVKEMEEEKFEDAITAYEEVRKMWADLEPTALREVERKISNALSYAKERGTLVANELAGEELKSDYKKLQGYINSSHVKKDENDYGEALNLLQRVEDLKPIFEKELEVLKRKMTEMEARRETEERARTAGEKAKLALAWMEAKNFSNQTKAIMDRVAAIKEDMRKGEIALKSQEWEQAVSFFEVVDQDWNWLKEHYQSETVKESVPPSDPVDPVASVPVTTPENMMINLPGGVVLEMVYCPPGTFQMGSPESEPYRLPNETAHQVTLTKGFWIGKYEVTQEQWKTVMGNTSNGLQDSQNGRYPVYQVSYQECLQFCSRIRQMAQTQGSTVRRGRFRLPTEAEWEYACRAGSTTAYPWGNDYNAQKLNCNSMGTNPPNSRLQPVGTYSANAWGLYDMLGNVLEWCSDYYEPFKSDPLVDPQGARFSQTRVLRGGSWADVIVSCRSASRIFYAPNKGMGNFGFRLCYSER